MQLTTVIMSSLTLGESDTLTMELPYTPESANFNRKPKNIYLGWKWFNECNLLKSWLNYLRSAQERLYLHNKSLQLQNVIKIKHHTMKALSSSLKVKKLEVIKMSKQSRSCYCQSSLFADSLFVILPTH